MAGRKPASFGRFRRGASEVPIPRAFQIGLCCNPRQSGVCGQAPRKPLFHAGPRPAWPEKPILRGLELWGNGAKSGALSVAGAGENAREALMRAAG